MISRKCRIALLAVCLTLLLCGGALAASLDALSPLKVLGRGYALAQRPDGTVFRRQSPRRH